MSFKTIANARSAAGMPTGLLAVWWVIASEIVIFGGLLMAYLMHRLAHDAWAGHANHTNQYIGAFNTLVLLISRVIIILSLMTTISTKSFLEQHGSSVHASGAAAGVVERFNLKI